MSSSELDLLEAQLREKWGGIAAPPNLTPEEEVIAAKLLGKGEAKRLANTPSGARYRYRRPVVRAEYFWVPSSQHHRYSTPDEPGFWAVDVFEDNKRRRWWEGSWDLCRFIVKAMEDRRIPVKFAGGSVPETEPKASPPPTSRRRRMLLAAGEFRL